MIPQRKYVDKRPSAIFKLVCYTLFDNSPVNALKYVEGTWVPARGLPAPTPSKKQSSFPQPEELEWSKSVPIQHFEASTSASVEYGAEKPTNPSYSLPRSPQHGGGKFMKVFKRRSSKRDLHVTNHSNLSSPDESTHDIIYNGDVSSNSLFEIEVENEEKFFMDPQCRMVVNRLESEVEMWKRKLEKEEQEVKKLKDEVSSLRSRATSSRVQSPKSSGSDKIEGFGTVRSPSESSRTSTSDKYDGDSQTYMDYCPSDEGQLVKLAQESRSRICMHEASKSLVDAEGDAHLVRRSSLSKEDLEQYCSEPTHEHMDTFLSDAASLGSRGTLERYFQIGCEYQEISSQPLEGLGHMILSDPLSKEKEPSLKFWNISEDDYCSDGTTYLEHAEDAFRSKERGSGHFVLSDTTSGDLTAFDRISLEENHDEPSFTFSGQDHVKPMSGDAEAETLQEDRLPSEPEIAERRRQVKIRYQELEEKLLKILISPRRDNYYKSTSYSSSSAPRSGTSSPASQVTTTSTKDLDLELSSPRDILVSKFGSVVKTGTLYYRQPEDIDTTTGVVHEVYFHPILSRSISLDSLSGFKQHEGCATRGGESSHTVDQGISKDKPSGTQVEDGEEVTGSRHPNYVRPFLPLGYKRTRFYYEAARLILQQSAELSEVCAVRRA